jgi:RNA ligase (TIGR02306 family)
VEKSGLNWGLLRTFFNRGVEMPSDLIVPCARVKSVKVIPDTQLSVVEILGWQVVTRTDTNPQVGELRVYIPPDAILPQKFVDEHGILYLKKGNRVGQIRLQGEMSFGMSLPNTWGFEEGEDVSEKLGITKYEPPPKNVDGDQETDHPLFISYCNIENFRNFPDIFEEGEEVVALEKVEGTNSRVGLVQVYFADVGDIKVEYMIGSHNTRRKSTLPSEKMNLYEFPLGSLSIKRALRDIMMIRDAKAVIFFGEIFGAGVPNGAKSMRYGRKDKDYCLFDIYVDGNYLDWDDLRVCATEYNLPLAPILYRGPFSRDVLEKYANQPTALMDENPHLSEGVTIRPIKERRYSKNNRRLILKYKSQAYEDLKAKGKAE